MTRKMDFQKYEFHCPQFVDFCSGVEGMSSDDGSFDSAFPDKKSELILKSKCPIRKPLPRNRILSSTPFKASFVNMSCRTNTTDSEKIYNRTKKFFKRQSKSMDSLHHLLDMEEREFSPVVCRKRSVSANDKPKRLTRPVTPKCLKRSLQNSRNKIFKTTEELELEKITLLQKQMSDSLRANEVAMRKLKMKCTQTSNMQKDLDRQETKEEKKNTRSLPSRLDLFLERINAPRNLCSRTQREIIKGQCPIDSELKRANHSNKIFQHFQNRLNMAGPSNAHLTSVRNEDGAFLKYTEIFQYHTNRNAENIQSMKFLRPSLKSRRCLFQENRQSPF